MKKILFILGMYHPNYSANGLCCKNVIDKCADKGWQVTCIVNAARGNEKEYTLDGVEIYPIKPRLFLRISEWCDSCADSKLCGVVKKAAVIANKLKLFLMSPFWPLISPFYTHRFYKMAKQLHADKDFDIVVTAYTPIDSLLAGYFLKKKYPQIKFVPYYLDTFAGGWGPSRWSKEKKDKRTRNWETKIDEKADLVISMEASREYHNNHPLEVMHPIKRTYLDVPMMLPEIKTERCDKPRKLALFAGTVAYPQRNPIPLLEVFSMVCKEEDIELVFVGQCNNISIFKPYTDLSEGKIRYLGVKSHEEVGELEKKADFLINIGSVNPYTIPCKIFEYMRFSKPIISTLTIENEPSVKYLNKYGNVFFLDERLPFDESAERLLDFIKNSSLSKLPQGYCQRTFWANTPDAFTQTMEDNFFKGESR